MTASDHSERECIGPVMVRAALPGDVPAVFRIRVSVRQNHLSMAELAARGITEQWVARLMVDGALRTWCAECDGRVVGFSMVKIHAREVFALFVAPGFEGRGIGSRLLREAVGYLAGSGARTVRLSTGPGTRAHSFYLRRGWQEVGLDEHNEDVLLELKPAPPPGAGESR